MKFKTTILFLIFSTLSLTISSCSKQKEEVKKEYLIDKSQSEFNINGNDKCAEGDDYVFTIDYENNYQSKKLIVKANNKEISPENGTYTISNIQNDLLITTELEEKSNYEVLLNRDNIIYDIYSFENDNIVAPNQNYTFTIHFWGETDLSNAKVTANNTIIYPENFNGEYKNSTNYQFILSNINQDVTISIQDAFHLTWYTYKMDDKFDYEHSVYAQKDVDTYKIGNKFIGWSTVEDDKNYIVNIPYLNPTDKKEVTLYAIYELDDNNIDIPFINIITESKELSKESFTKADIIIMNKRNTKSLKGQIKIRGNSTSTYPKKPLKIKFDLPIAFDNSKKYKDWVLLADFIDPSLIRNYTALTMSNYTENLDFRHTLMHVEVQLNGKYQGVYLLTDEIEVQENGRVRIENKNINANQKRVPFLIERHNFEDIEKEKNYFLIGQEYYIVKYPKYPTSDQMDYIETYIKDLIKSIDDRNLSNVDKLLDLESLYDYVLLNELMVNLDSRWKSGYIYKPANGKLTFGPVWDFDWALSLWTSTPITEQEFKLKEKLFLIKEDSLDFIFDWMIKLIQNEDIYFELLDEWESFTKAYKKTLKDIKNYYPYIKEAAMRNYAKWYEYEYKLGGLQNYVPKNDNLFNDQYNFVLNSLKERYEYLDSILRPDNHKFFINPKYPSKSD